METGSLHQNIPDDLPQEISETLVRSGNVRIARIVSRGHHSTPDFWYDQQDSEWILLVKGAARLRFEEGNRIVDLMPGMHVNIRAHEKHRVESTSETEETIWLAVFY
jgi:cupin 2 domain-containing protein